ncbi:VOC family protein [Actinomycetospora aeridis]|uniref:VOC family protein n=1 Tax=Actinomycetospora aeridis TaxID=3129231 RepID=A0ABU8MZ25_9PSEU
MFDHVGFPCGDVETSVAFYTSVFAPLGLAAAVRIPTGPPGAPEVVGLGAGGHPGFWLAPGQGVEQELHVAFTAPDRAAVDAVHEAAQAHGAEVLHAPRIFTEYHPGYYAVFLRDPDGHNVEAVHHTWG